MPTGCNLPRWAIWTAVGDGAAQICSRAAAVVASFLLDHFNAFSLFVMHLVDFNRCS